MSPDERFREATPEPPKFDFTPSYEEFAAWCRHPVTSYVAQALMAISERYKTEWSDHAWGTGTIDPLMLSRYRAYSDAYASFSQSKRDDYVRAFEA
jgi:hypothetical protein